MTEGRTIHIPELQALRGIAASAVMVGHALVYYDTPAWFLSLATLANGRAAVVIFFVLSGYVLSRALHRTRFDQDAILRFYLQRVFRIYPAIWAASSLSLIYIFALHWQIAVPHEGEMMRSVFRVDRFDALHIIASLAGMTTFVLPPLWTIFIEIVASVAMPGIAFIALYRPRHYPWVLAAAIVLSFAWPDTYYHTTMYLMDFIVGAGLATSSVSRWFSNMPARIAVVIGLLLLACSQLLPLDYYSPLAHAPETVVSALIIGSLVGGQQRVSWLGSRVLLFIGDISYSVYLLHFPVLCIVAKGLTVFDNPIALSVLLATLTSLITLPLAWLCYEFVEKPGIALGRHTTPSLLRLTWGHRA